MERYSFDPISRTLTISAGFARAISDANDNSDEYNLFLRMRKEIPDLKVKRKTHASPISYKDKNGGKRTPYYPTKNLSYERMEKFMNALPDGGHKYLDEYHILREKAEAMCLAPYAPVARWFMAQFPEFRKDPLFYIKPEHLPDVVDYATFLEKVA